MAGNTKESGKIIICMEKENILGVMEEYTKDNMKMIKNLLIFLLNFIVNNCFFFVREMEFIYGLMGKNTRVNGKTVNKTEEECINCLMERKKLGSGKMVNI